MQFSEKDGYNRDFKWRKGMLNNSEDLRAVKQLFEFTRKKDYVPDNMFLK